MLNKLKGLEKYMNRKKALSPFVLLGTLAFAPLASAADVVIAYQGIINPWKRLIADETILEKATGLDVEFRQFDSGAKVLSALASGAVQIGTAGSSPIAAGISQGVEVDLFWILENINDAEALVVRDGSSISAPQDLKGKKIGVPFVSTTHFHTLFALEQFGLNENDVQLVNLQPNAIAAAWERGDIDAAFVWDPALGRIKQNGQVLITSGELSRWGKSTFDGLVVSRDFAKAHGDFLTTLVSQIAAHDEAYRQKSSTLSLDDPLTQDIVKVTGASAETVPSVLALYDFPDLNSQISTQWLGGGAAQALKFTSEFLHQQEKIPAVLPDYSAHVTDRFAKAALSQK